MWKTRTVTQGTKAEADLLARAWKPIASTSQEVIVGPDRTLIAQLILIHRDPITTCDGCMHRAGSQVCRRYPDPKVVDGNGCGEYE